MKTVDFLQLLRKRQGNRPACVLAAELGISPQYLCDIYKGKREPGPRLLAEFGVKWVMVKDSK